MPEYYQGPNNSARLKIVTITLACVATVLVVWRITWRIKKKVIGLTDYLLLLGYGLSVCVAGLNLAPYFQWGYGYHKSDVPPEIVKSVRPKICFYLVQVFFKATAGVIKLSVAAIYMTIFEKSVLLPSRIARVCNFALMGVVVAYYTGGTLVSAFQCTPVRKAWISSVDGHCIDNDQFRGANAYINALTSVLLVIMPFPALLATEHRSKELWQFFGLVSIGLVHTGCAICRIVQIYTPVPGASTDPQWYNTNPNTIAMAEIFTALLVSTMLTMRPCFKIFGHAIISTLTSASKVGTRGSKPSSRTLTSTSVSSPAPKGFQGFNRLGPTPEVDIELEGDCCSTNDLAERSYPLGYHPYTPFHTPYRAPPGDDRS